MDLWIRSQDKTLLEKAVTVKIAHLHNESIKEEDFTYSIIVNNDYVFADYKTKERALEVLDEIQEHLEKMGKDEILTDKIGIMNGIKHYGIVYKMPEE